MNNILKNNSFSKEFKLKYIVLKEKKVYNSIAEAEKDNKLKTGSRITEVLKDQWCLTENKEEVVNFWNKEKI